MASGASIGSLAGTGLGALLGPAGSALGGLAGGVIGGLFDSEEEVPAWQNFSDPRIAAIIQRLMRGNLGEKQSAAAAGRNTRNVNRQMEKLDNDPNFSGNPITRAAIGNQMALGAEEANVGARLAGAQQDQQAMMQAAQLQQGQQQFSAQRNAFEQGRYQLQQQPTGLDVLAGQATGYAFGNFLGDPTGLGGSPGQEEVPGGQQQALDYNALFNAQNDPNAKKLKNRPIPPSQGFQFNPPQFNPYQMGPTPSSMFNYGYGYNPLR